MVIFCRHFIHIQYVYVMSIQFSYKWHKMASNMFIFPSHLKCTFNVAFMCTIGRLRAPHAGFFARALCFLSVSIQVSQGEGGSHRSKFVECGRVGAHAVFLDLRSISNFSLKLCEKCCKFILYCS